MRFWKRLVVVLVAVTAAPLFGPTAAQADLTSGASQVVDVGTFGFLPVGTQQCQEPPCGPEPPPTQIATCAHTIAAPARILENVRVRGRVRCYILDQAQTPIAMSVIHIVYVTIQRTGEISTVFGTEYHNRSETFVDGTASIGLGCRAYTTYMRTRLAPPPGWSWSTPGPVGVRTFDVTAQPFTMCGL
jgi:hypothetical protein